jgi:hypothetical protein
MRAIVSFERGQNFSFDEVELLRRGFGKRPEFRAYVADAGTGSLAGMAVHYEIPFMHTLQLRHGRPNGYVCSTPDTGSGCVA